MKTTLKTEVPLIITVLLPLIYLAYIWNGLPSEVPIHWNASGEIDGYGSKETLVFIALLIPTITYLTFLIIPKIDPKGKLNQIGNK